MSAPRIFEHEIKLAELKAERDTLASARTKEGVRAMAEQWLAAACARHNGAAAGFVLNGHANPEHVQAILAEFLLESPALADFITKKVETTTELSERQNKTRLAKLDTEIAKVAAVVREHALAAAHAAVDEQFGGAAA